MDSAIGLEESSTVLAPPAKRRLSFSSSSLPLPLAKKQCISRAKTATDLFQEKAGGQGLVFFSKATDEKLRFLSNFALVEDPSMEIDGKHYATVEHYYQAEKVRMMGFEAYAEEIRAATSPEQAKKMGSKSSLIAHAVDRVKRGLGPSLAACVRHNVGGKPVSRELTQEPSTFPSGCVNKSQWGSHLNHVFPTGAALEEIMRKGLVAKFEHDGMKRLLLDTGTRLLAEKRGRSGDKNIWTMTSDGSPGLLGEILMEIRTYFNGGRESV